MKQEFTDRLKKLFCAEKKTVLLTAVGIAGILLILLSEFTETPKNEQKTPIPQTDESTYNAQYVTQLEQNLEQMLERIDGVGEAAVSVTLESGVRYEYATEGRNSQDTDYSENGRYATQSSSETSVILVERSGVKEPLVLRRIEPTVQGVVIVCSGGGDPAIKEEVVRVACVLCGVRSNRVSVSKAP